MVGVERKCGTLHAAIFNTQAENLHNNRSEKKLQKKRIVMARREEKPHEKRDMLLPRIQRLDSPLLLRSLQPFRPYRAFGRSVFEFSSE